MSGLTGPELFVTTEFDCVFALEKNEILQTYYYGQFKDFESIY